ncbi:hypothetical protein ElyMa_003975100 [Elysia marginata]|uniref:Uncharacterized protein n=1 Tax=Elysia marginata TaxID=1093978 RepID=A0AAV4FW45_9GAST|nr:hypothetical protein ElyMa_003975100 [Elysia marginata]
MRRIALCHFTISEKACQFDDTSAKLYTAAHASTRIERSPSNLQGPLYPGSSHVAGDNRFFDLVCCSPDFSYP